MTMVGVLTKLVAEMHVELFFVAFAILSHVLVFSFRGYLLKLGDRRPKDVKVKLASTTRSATTRRTSDTGAPLAQALLQAIHSDADESALAAQINTFLANSVEKEDEEETEVLASVLKKIGAPSINAELISAVRRVLKERSLFLGAQLGEGLLRAYHYMRLHREFEDLYAQLELAGELSPTAESLAIDRAAAIEDLDTALRRVSRLVIAWQALGKAKISTTATPWLHGLLRLGDKKDALPRVLRVLDDGEILPQQVYEIMLAACKSRQDGKISSSIADLHGAMAAELPSNQFCSLLKNLGAMGRLQEAVSLFRAHPERESCHYNAILDACAEQKDAGLAESLVAEAVQASVANHASYLTLAKARCRAGDQQGTLSAMKKMRNAGMVPTISMFNDVLDMATFADSRYAVNWMDELDAFRLVPNRITLSIFLKNVQPDQPRRFVDRVFGAIETHANSVDEAFLCFILESCLRADRLDHVRRQLDKWHRSGSVQASTTRSCATLIRAYGAIHRVEDVWNVWRSLRARHLPETSILVGCMVEALVSNEECEGAYNLIHALLRDETKKGILNAVVYCSVLKGFSHQGRMERVWSLYEEMRSAKIEFTVTTYNALIDACARANDMKRTPGLLQHMIEQGIQPNLITYSTLIKGNSRLGRFDKALEVVKEMKNAQMQPDEHIYNTLLNGCYRKGLYERGMQLLNEMESTGIPPSNFTLSVLVNLVARVKGADMAFEVCQRVAAKHNIHLNIHVYNNLIKACIDYQDIMRAFSAFDELSRNRLCPDTRTYTLLLNASLDFSYGEGVAKVLRFAAQQRAGAHSSRTAEAPQARSGLPSELAWEALEGLSKRCDMGVFALQLVRELKGPLGLQGSLARLL